MRLFTLVVLALVAGALLTGGRTAQATMTVVVTPDNMQGWGFFEEIPTGSGGMVPGPSTPPVGAGSANLIVDSTGREMLSTVAYAGTAFSSITTLQYSTYRASGSSALAVSLQFDVDYDLTDGNTSWQGRIVFEPYYTNTVLTGVWQTWDTLTNVGTGNWWATGAPGSSVCPIGNPCTWSELLSAFPNAGVRANVGATHLKAGGPWTGGFNGNADKLVVGTTVDTITYDFDLAQPGGTPVAVGGVLGLNDGAGIPATASDGASADGYAVALLAGALVAVVGSGAWYVRRRWGR